MTFRRAQLGDVERVAQMLGRFYAKIGIAAYQVPFDYPSAVETVKDTVLRGICLVGPRSCAGAFAHQFPFNKSVKFAYVQFWCFERAREIMIFEALMDECERGGAVRVIAASHPPNHRIGKYYRKLAGREFEGSWCFDV